MTSEAILLWVVTPPAPRPEKHGQKLQIYIPTAGVVAAGAHAMCLSRIEP